ncbi:pilus assembly protein [Granulosicoccus sp.]|nr:TadE/TadG family type IV pilus assembly protein [Granulosicoccus sp.]MDB4222391.1 pilus assembly protein [Granulosicoccus sp.]
MKTEKHLAKGSALVETTVVLVVMLPLIFALAMVGNLIDLKQNMEQASRYTSWETTVSAEPNESISTARIRTRFFSAADAPISSEAQSSTVSSLWGDSEQSLGDLQSASAVVLDQSSVAVLLTENIVSPTAAMKIGEAAARSGEILDGVSGNSWGLSSSGPSSVSVGAKIKSSAWLPATISGCSQDDSHVCLNSRAVILNDTWSSSGDAQAAQRVRSLMPATVLEPIGNAVSVVGNLPMFQELKDLKGAFGHVDMGVLPEYLE